MTTDPCDRPHNLWQHKASNWRHWSWKGKYPTLTKAEDAADTIFAAEHTELVALPCGTLPVNDG